MQSKGEVALHWAVLSAAPAVLAVAPPAMMLSLHLLQKAATSGAPLAQFGSDLVAAVAIGLVAMACCGYVLHMLALSHHRRLKVRVVGLHACRSSPGAYHKTPLQRAHWLACFASLPEACASGVNIA